MEKSDSNIFFNYGNQNSLMKGSSQIFGNFEDEGNFSSMFIKNNMGLRNNMSYNSFQGNNDVYLNLANQNSMNNPDFTQSNEQLKYQIKEDHDLPTANFPVGNFNKPAENNQPAEIKPPISKMSLPVSNTDDGKNNLLPMLKKLKSGDKTK